MPFLSNEGFRSLTTKWCDDAMFTKYICWYLFDFLTGNHFDSMDRVIPINNPDKDFIFVYNYAHIIGKS